METVTLTFEKITESDRTITFSPPLIVEISLQEIAEINGGPSAYLDIADATFDFGMNLEIYFDTFITQELTQDWVIRTKKMIEFELMHSFFHPTIDPNYSITNWALLGNLAHRVECSEDWKFDGTDIERWKYTKDFRRIFE